MTEYYKEDLAYIHDEGHSEFAIKSAPGILDILRSAGVDEGLVVDLGCGSGIWARELTRAGFSVFGIDISPWMIHLAQRRVRGAEFQAASLFKARLPSCVAVTSLGECLNYLFDRDSGASTLGRLFKDIFGALTPGGLFIFDIANTRLHATRAALGLTRNFTHGKDWVVLVEKQLDPAARILTRRIVSFRKHGKLYRRSEEVHFQQLYEAREIAAQLRAAGFRVRPRRGYGRYLLPSDHSVFIARKPF